MIVVNFGDRLTTAIWRRAVACAEATATPPPKTSNSRVSGRVKRALARRRGVRAEHPARTGGCARPPTRSRRTRRAWAGIPCRDLPGWSSVPGLPRRPLNRLVHPAVRHRDPQGNHLLLAYAPGHLAG